VDVGLACVDRGWGRNDQASSQHSTHTARTTVNQTALLPRPYIHAQTQQTQQLEAGVGTTQGTPPVTPCTVTDDLVIAGNVFINRQKDATEEMDLGISACDDSNPTCNTAQVRAS